jgi:hypothetical protein
VSNIAVSFGKKRLLLISSQLVLSGSFAAILAFDNGTVFPYINTNYMQLTSSHFVFSAGMLMSTLAGDVNIALAVAPPIMIPFMMFGGFFLNSE